MKHCLLALAGLLMAFPMAGPSHAQDSDSNWSRWAFWRRGAERSNTERSNTEYRGAAPRGASRSSRGFARKMILYAGPSLYSASADEGAKSRSLESFAAGFSQTLIQVSSIGDLLLKTEVQHFRLQSGRATQLSAAAALRLPEAESGFPVYVGLGPGIGFYPYHLIKGDSWLSVSGLFLFGLAFADVYENLGFNIETSLNIHYPMKEKKLYMEALLTLGLIFSF